MMAAVAAQGHTVGTTSQAVLPSWLYAGGIRGAANKFQLNHTSKDLVQVSVLLTFWNDSNIGCKPLA
jgi:hypothetical protein